MVVAMEERKKQDNNLQAVWFAAGVAALMACLERAMLVSFVEQWRVIAFLALNLLLLAILFTSRSSTPSPFLETTSASTIKDTPESSKIEKKEVKECKKHLVPCAVDEEVSEEATKDKNYTLENREENQLGNVGETDNYSIDETQQISMEELNERAEAFIAMFRQHLISDAKAYSYNKTKSCNVRSPSPLKGSHKIFSKSRTTIY